MKRKEKGFTVVELLTVVAIIALLVGLLIPALTAVKMTAKETKQRGQFTTIDLALAAFKNDYGDYPPSNWWDPDSVPPDPRNYCGAQKLAEALVGWDLMGFHPRSDFRANGRTAAGVFVYDPTNLTFMEERKGPYLELERANAFRLGDISADRPGLFIDAGQLAPDTFVLCDVFGVKKITTVRPGMGMPEGTTERAGTPILYYKANTSSKVFGAADGTVPYRNQMYNPRDNFPLIDLGRLTDWDKPPSARRRHIRFEDTDFFFEYLRNPKVAARPWPYRPDSYILISAGPDGEYGTGDDITNFGK